MKRAAAWSYRQTTLHCAAVVCAGGLSSCSPQTTSSDIEAQFGVFYGGQVQRLARIPFESDRARQTQGFRLERPVAPTAPLRVVWEVTLARSGPTVKDSRGRSAQRREVRYGSDRWLPGALRFEYPVVILPEDPLGRWNVRVLVEGRVVLDRPFAVFKPRKGE